MLVELTNGLVARGHKVTILMPTYGEVAYDVRATLLRIPDVKLHAHYFPFGDVIISNFFTTVLSAQQASEQGKGIHIRLALCYEPAFLAENHLSFPSYHMTKHLLVLSRWQQELIYLNHGVKGSVVPVGIHPFFQNLHIREQLNWPLNITAILRNQENGYSWHREQYYLVEQLNQVLANYPHVEVNFISPPQEFYNSPSLQQLKSTNKYRFYTPGNDEELRYHYNQSDIFVSSSSYDAGSLPGLEAMRCGAALVTIYAGGNLDYCFHEKNCLMSYRYENRLAQDIARLIIDSELRRRLASQGESDTYQWTWDNSVSAFEKAVFDKIKLANAGL